MGWDGKKTGIEGRNDRVTIQPHSHPVSTRPTTQLNHTTTTRFTHLDLDDVIGGPWGPSDHRLHGVGVDGVEVVREDGEPLLAVQNE